MTVQLHESLLTQLAGIFTPVTSIQSPDDLRRLLQQIGWDLDALVGININAVIAASTNVRTAADKLMDVAIGGSGELKEYIGATLPLTQAVVSLVTSMRGWSPANVPANALDLLPGDLLGFLLDQNLRLASPRTASALRLLGVLVSRSEPAIATPDGVVLRQAMDRPQVDTIALQRLLNDPLGFLSERYLHNAAGARLLAETAADLLGPRVADVVDALGGIGAYGLPGAGAGLGMTADELAVARHMVSARFEVKGEPDLNSDVETAAAAFLLAGALTDDTNGRGMGVVIAPSGILDVISGPVHTTLTGNPGAVLVTTSGADFDTAGAKLTLRLDYTSMSKPAVRFGSPSGTRFEIAEITVGISGDLAANVTDVGATAELTSILLAISGGDGDGYLAKVLPTEPITATADIAADWTMRTGLKVRGSGTLEIRITTHHVIGPIKLDEIVLRAGISDQGVEADVGVGATLALGPIVATMQGLGLRAGLRPGTESMIDVDFKPPHQIGFAIEAASVTGGGLVSIDEAAHQYIGILQLDIAGVVAVSAIGILTTRMPDGSDGFSLLVLITAEFPPIQLGFGFALTGLGGLLGVNRSFVVNTLQSGIRTGALGSILFPKGAVANANQLISSLTTVFPPAAGRHVFGPMIKLGWGPNQLLSFELGLVLELPSPLRLAIIGKCLVILPDKDAAIVQLRLDILGILDFALGEASVDASLIDSRIATFAVTGDMAIRTGWKATKGFAVAVGGFHPMFSPPPGFPTLQRLAISLATGDNPRIRMEMYFAVTSNTIQFGGRIDLFVGAGPFSARGFAGLDAIVELSPFHFAITLSLGIDIMFDGSPLLHAQLEGTLEGPLPWRAYGYVEFRVLLIGGRIDVDLVIGDQPAEEPVRVRLDNILREALLADDAWSAQLPSSGATGVSIRSTTPGEGLVVHPLGRFSVRQRAIPLDVPISRYGAARPAPNSPTLFALQSIFVGTTGIRIDDPAPQPVSDYFAAAQFADLTEDEKLSRPGFEEMNLGGTAGLRRYRWPVTAEGTPLVVAATLAYDEAIVNRDEPLSQQHTGVMMEPALGAALARDGVAGHSTARRSVQATPDQRISLVAERYVAGPRTTMPDPAGATSYARAATGIGPGERVLTAAEVS